VTFSTITFHFFGSQSPEPCRLLSIQSSFTTPGSLSSIVAVRPIRSLSIWQCIIRLPWFIFVLWKWNSSKSMLRSINRANMDARVQVLVSSWKTNTKSFFEKSRMMYCKFILIGFKVKNNSACKDSKNYLLSVEISWIPVWISGIEKDQ